MLIAIPYFSVWIVQCTHGLSACIFKTYVEAGKVPIVNTRLLD